MKRSLCLLLLLIAPTAVAARRRSTLPPSPPTPRCTVVRGLAPMLLSTDGGKTFGGNEAPIPTNVFVRGVAALDASTVLVATIDALYQSNDGGCTYGAIASLSGVDLPPTIAAAGASRAFIWSRETLSRWDRGSVTPLVPPVQTIQALGVNARNPDHVRIVDGRSNMWESRDAGGTWSRRGAAETAGPYDVAFDPNDFDHAVRSTGAIQMSRDGGETWTASATPSDVVYDVAFSPVDPAVVWACGYLMGLNKEALLVSDDGGASFRVAAFTAVAHDNGILVPSPREAERVIWLSGNGLRAFDLRSGQVTPLADIVVERFAVSPANADVVYAARSHWLIIN
jgi:hypothetical protein